MSRIEFIEGEKYCRFDGVEMTPEKCIELYGYEGEINMLDDDMIEIDGTIYTDAKLIDILRILGEEHGEVEDYDAVLSKNAGFAQHCAEKDLENSIVIKTQRIEYIESIKPFEQFSIDYPNLNMEKYNEFYDALNEYYDNLFGNR